MVISHLILRLPPTLTLSSFVCPCHSGIFAAVMNSNDPVGDPITTARKLISLIAKSITTADEAKSLALMNARSILDFELSLTSIELGNGEFSHENHARPSRNVHPLLRVLENLVQDNIDQNPNPDDTFQKPWAAPATPFGYETDLAQPSLAELSQSVNKLQDAARILSQWRKDPSAFGIDLERTQNRHSKNCETPSKEGYQQNGGRLWKRKKVSPKQEAAEEFMEQALNFYEQRIEPLENKIPIKVAVLDTGVDKKEVHFKAVRLKYGTCLKETVSFIDDDSHDSHGHGTQVAALVVEMAPHADLYIAKVCEEKAIDGVHQYVEAIKWAMEQRVHIINISASLDEDIDIENAIREAEAQGIIVFAAASDNVANNPRAFPACMDQVLAVHSTNGRGRIGDGNPEPMAYRANISTLGENIVSPLSDGQLICGSSYSTAIASGMAANILTIADAYLGTSDEDKRLKSLAFRREGMQRMLLFISKKPDKYGYNFVCPSKIAKHCDKKDGYHQWLKMALALEG